jgi:hypothetical protein
MRLLGQRTVGGGPNVIAVAVSDTVNAGDLVYQSGDSTVTAGVNTGGSTPLATGIMLDTDNSTVLPAYAAAWQLAHNPLMRHVLVGGDEQQYLLPFYGTYTAGMQNTLLFALGSSGGEAQINLGSTTNGVFLLKELVDNNSNSDGVYTAWFTIPRTNCDYFV